MMVSTGFTAFWTHEFKKFDFNNEIIWGQKIFCKINQIAMTSNILKKYISAYQ